jgi:tetratricopeptide (TPR) repeat protein
MKNLLIVLLTIIGFGLSSFNLNGYEKAMKTSLEVLKQAQGKAEFLNVANTFERIAKAEKDQWLPYYYTAYAKIIASTLEENLPVKDVYLDEAEVSINSLLLLDHDKVEVLALESFVNMMRISVDPAGRGQIYSLKAADFLEEATAIDEENPRVILLMAYLQHGSAQFFNADTGPACERFAKALELFDKPVEEVKPLWPTWGRGQAEAMVKKCAG